MTMRLEIGKLYTCPEYHLLVFPTEESAAPVTSATAGAGAAGRAGAAYYADWWSKKLNCNVSFIPAGQVFCCVEIGSGAKNDHHQIHVVAGECMGWINVADWLKIEEVVD